MKIFQTLMSLFLIVSSFSVSFPNFSFQLINPAMASTLVGVVVIPVSNLVNERETYEIFLITATTATIKTIEMAFPSGFDLSLANKVIEKSGIGSGSLSATGTVLKYTVNSPVSVPAGTTIRLEIGRIVATSAGTFNAIMRTLSSADALIDGPTTSAPFTIKAITGNDVSSNFMLRKTLLDDAAGHAHGWDPDDSISWYTVHDPDILAKSENEFISIMVRNANSVFCTPAIGDTGLFVVYCDSAPGNSAILDYIVTKLPAHVITSTTSSTSSVLSSPFSALQTQR